MTKNWTKEEDEFLMSHYLIMNAKEISIRLKRTQSGVEGRRLKLGLKVGGTIVSNLNRARNFNVLDNYDSGWLFGMYLGDGWVTNKNPLIGLTCIDIELCEKFREVVSVIQNDTRILDCIIYEKDPVISVKNDGEVITGKEKLYTVRIGASKFGRFLKDFFKEKSLIPNNLSEYSRDFRFGFLAGILDSEGGFHNHIRTGTTGIYIGMKSKEIMFSIYKIAEELGIKTQKFRYCNHSETWRFGFNIKSLVESGINLYCDRKMRYIFEYECRFLNQCKVDQGIEIV